MDEPFNKIVLEVFILGYKLDWTELCWALDFIKLDSILLFCKRISVEEMRAVESGAISMSLVGLGDCCTVLVEVITSFGFSTTEGVGLIRTVRLLIFEITMLDADHDLCDGFLSLNAFEFPNKNEVS